MHLIRFYEKKAPYYEFSNFYEAPIIIDGVRWNTVEHYYQAMKFTESPEYQDYIRQCSTPYKAFVLGKQKLLREYRKKWLVDKNTCPIYLNVVIHRFNTVPIRSDWDDVKESIMEKALIAKFTQHDALRQLLLDTADAEIIEDSPRDAYWGVGRNGKGLNRLGALLMQIRTTLRSP